MNQSEIIFEEPWSYVVFDCGEAVYLTFITGGVCEVDHSIQLTESEKLAVIANPAFAAEIIRRLNSNQQELFARVLPSPIWPSKS